MLLWGDCVRSRRMPGPALLPAWGAARPGSRICRRSELALCGRMPGRRRQHRMADACGCESGWPLLASHCRKSSLACSRSASEIIPA